MAPFWDSLSRSFGRTVRFEAPGSQDDYLPPTPSGKRKASEPQRSSRYQKAQRYSAPSPRRRAPGTYTTLAQEEGESGPYEENSVTPRRPSIRRPSIKSVQGANEDYLGGAANTVKIVFSKLTGTGGVEATTPAANEADIQDKLLAEHPDEEIEALYVAEFQDDYDDAYLSEGEWGRRHFGPPPWAKNTAERDDMMESDPQTKPRPGKPITKTHAANAPTVAAPKFVSYNKIPSLEAETVGLNKSEDNSVKPKVRLPIKGYVKPDDRPVISTIKPVVTSKPVANPINKLEITGTSQVKPVITEKPLKDPHTTNAAKPLRKPAVMKQWTEAPYERFRTIYEDFPTSYLAQAQKELQEPVYSFRDAEVRDMMWQIQDGIEEVAGLFQGTIPIYLNRETSDFLTRMYTKRTVSTSRVVKAVAGKARTDEEEWYDIFATDPKRKALVCGIIGNVLVEQVFKHPFFGGDERYIDALFGLQRDLRDEEAFTRKYQSAMFLSSHIIGENLSENPNEPKTIVHPPENFATHVDAIVTALDIHLNPLLSILCEYRKTSKEGTEAMHWSIIEALQRLVVTAGFLSLQMAVDPFAVYHHVPVAKGEPFSNDNHDAYNGADMESEASRKRAMNRKAVVSMMLMDGLAVYRAGGWEAPESDPAWDGDGFVERVYAKEEFVGVGYRRRLLTHGWVFCKWERMEEE